MTFTISGPKREIRTTKLNGSSSFRPRYSERNLLLVVPKKFVTKRVMSKQKLSDTLISPNKSLPKYLATIMLKINGTVPTKNSAMPV